MTASEKTKRKEAELRRHISKIRWITGSLFLIFTVLCIVFVVLRETTAEVYPWHGRSPASFVMEGGQIQ